ncbi:MAG TPA: RNB domain-containing ribonuclease [Bryobacteraceae bacterium]|jgi:exoribonuclease-2|nr:RNB domain-containing ribonuclease [Bryobacteraceae bacterium]
MPHSGFDLAAAARREMIAEGFDPDFPPAVEREAAALDSRPAPVPDERHRDLRSLPWSSIDNDTSRDLDQVEVAERVDGGIRVLVGIADVGRDVPCGSAIDSHAAGQTTSVYTGVRTFPMLPERLSTDLTSLHQDADRFAVVIEFVVAPDGSIASTGVYGALLRNRARLTYSAVGAWFEDNAPAPPAAASAALQAQLRLQNEAAGLLRDQRHRLGALDFDRLETRATVVDGEVRGFAAHHKNQAGKMIEDFMVAANGVMAATLRDARVSSIRRVVRAPERWPRIVEIARGLGETLPPAPDAALLSAFLQKRKAADPLRYPDLSLAIIKLMGPGEYALSRAGDSPQGHFALAAHDYSHSTAPNRRFADLVTQRLVNSVLAGKPAPYSDEALDEIARRCTFMEDAARKVERKMNKRIAAVAIQNRIGETFSAVVTGDTPKGVFVRILDPPLEGRLLRGQEDVDVGDRIRVKLLAADPQMGYIDFER